MHTPGPWFYSIYPKGGRFPHVVLGGDDPESQHYIIINDCRGQNGGVMEELNADAMLIAAAPDLLAACKGSLMQLSNNPKADRRPWVVAMVAAIAKAEGG